MYEVRKKLFLNENNTVVSTLLDMNSQACLSYVSNTTLRSRSWTSEQDAKIKVQTYFIFHGFFDMRRSRFRIYKPQF